MNEDDKQQKFILLFFKDYLWFICRYFAKVVRQLFSHLVYFINFLLYQIRNLNKFIVFRLIWQRGKLGRPLGHLGIVIITLMVLFMSSFFKSSNVFSDTNLATILKENQSTTTLNEDYLIHTAQSDTKLPEGRSVDEIKTYTVKGGDTLYKIAEDYNVTVDTLLAVNNLGINDYLMPGQELKILPVSGLEHEVQSGDTVESIAAKYKLDSPQPIIEINWLEKPYTLEAGQKLIIPGGIKPEPPKPIVTTPPSYALVTPTTPVVGSGQFLWPAAGYMSRGYGWFYGYFHGAIDIAASCGTPIYAGDSGTVEASGWRAGGWGNTVWLDHGNGYKSKYAHMTSTAVPYGARVSRGQLIGYVGETGLAYGCHLHFVIEKNGIAVNPQAVL